jgi:FtsP/CotA-like multicopper oxidase with cupredoxin domain
MKRTTYSLTILLLALLFVSGCAPVTDVRTGMMGNGVRGGVMGSAADASADNGLRYGSGYEQTNPETLPEAKPSAVVELADGASYTLTATKVKKTLAGKTLTFYGYNGMVPGPLFKVNKGSRVTITFVNELDKNTAVHWHGLRGDYRFDGVPGLGQDVIEPGELFTYELVFPDEGIYWYHPHVREDAQQDLGLSGNIFVDGLDAVAGVPDEEEFLVLDDIAISEQGIVPFGVDAATHAVMGRYGNVLLVNGETVYEKTVPAGSVLRLYLTNVANVRPFLLSIPGARIKLVGGDSGAYLRQEFVDSITITPAERYVVDVLFEEPGTYELRADNPSARHLLGTFTVTDGEPTSAGEAYETLRTNEDLAGHLERLRPVIDGEPTRTLELDFRFPDMHGGGMMGAMMADAHDGIEWEDTMPMMAIFTSEDVEWVIRDAASGAENKDLTISARVGDVEKWRLRNIATSDHPMQHPIHLHGQRFLVTAIDGEPVENPVWKDVVLVPIGHDVDIVVEYTNPGEWMLHCHIAEHLETGMFAYVSVADEDGTVYPRIGAKVH